MANEKIVVLYCGSSLIQQLYDKLLGLRTRPILLPSDTPIEEIMRHAPKAIIISGSPQYVNDPTAPRVDTRIYEQAREVPILGICYGMQLIARDLGGSVKRMASMEKESTEIKITEPASVLYQDFIDDSCFLWMVHICKVVDLPNHFFSTSKTKLTEHASMEAPDLGIYATQYHPEYKGSQAGTSVLWSFLNRIAGCVG